MDNGPSYGGQVLQHAPDRIEIGLGNLIRTKKSETKIRKADSKRKSNTRLLD